MTKEELWRRSVEDARLRPFGLCAVCGKGHDSFWCWRKELDADAPPRDGEERS